MPCGDAPDLLEPAVPSDYQWRGRGAPMALLSFEPKLGVDLPGEAHMRLSQKTSSIPCLSRRTAGPAWPRIPRTASRRCSLREDPSPGLRDRRCGEERGRLRCRRGEELLAFPASCSSCTSTSPPVLFGCSLDALEAEGRGDLGTAAATPQATAADSFRSELHCPPRPGSSANPFPCRRTPSARLFPAGGITAGVYISFVIIEKKVVSVSRRCKNSPGEKKIQVCKRTSRVRFFVIRRAPGGGWRRRPRVANTEHVHETPVA